MGLANIRKRASSFIIITSFLMNGGVFEISTYAAGEDSGETGTMTPFTHILLTSNSLTRFYLFRNTTTALFIRQAE